MRPGIRKIFTVILFFLTLWLCVRLVLPLLGPFLLGLMLALAAEPMAHFLQKRLHVPRAVSSGIAVGAAFCFLAMLLLLLCAFLIRELGALAGVLPELENAARSGVGMTQEWLLDLAQRAPEGIRHLLQENLHALFAEGRSLAGRVIRYLLAAAGNLLSHIPDSALGLGTAVVSAFLISAKLPRFRRYLLQHIPRQKRRALLAAGRRVRSTLVHWFTAQGKLSFVTFLILLVGLALLRLSYAPVWAAGICLVDALPVLGTGSILLPWALLLLLQGETARAIGLAGLYVTVAMTRSILEPKLLGRHLGLDPLVTLIAMYAGLKLWGIGGMLLSPILTVTALQLVPEQKLSGQ